MTGHPSSNRVSVTSVRFDLSVEAVEDLTLEPVYGNGQWGPDGVNGVDILVLLLPIVDARE